MPSRRSPEQACEDLCAGHTGALLRYREGAAVPLSSPRAQPTQPPWEPSPPQPQPDPQAKAPRPQIHLQSQDGAGGETAPGDPSLPRHHVLDPSFLTSLTGLSRWFKFKLRAKRKDPGEAIRQTLRRAASGPELGTIMILCDSAKGRP